MDIILDPDWRTASCTLWCGTYVTTIKGSPQAICENLCSRVMQPYYDEAEGIMKTKQVFNIKIDVMGVGLHYKDMLTGMGLTVTDVKAKTLDAVLPKLDPLTTSVSQKVTESVTFCNQNIK